MIRVTLLGWLSLWRRHPGQLVLLILGMALATSLWSAVQAINGEARSNYDRAMTQLGSVDLAALVPKAGTLPLSQYVALRRTGWKLAPVLEGRWRLNRDSYNLIGVDLLTHPLLPVLATESSTGPANPGSALDILRPPGRLFAGPDLEQELSGIPNIPPVTFSDRVPAGTILGDIGLVEDLLSKPGEISRVLILPDQIPGLPSLEQLAPDLQRIEPDQVGAAARLTDSFHLNLSAFGLLSFAVGLFIVHATIGLVFEQRRGLVRSLRAMGVPLRGLVLCALGELLVLALVSGGLGLVLGYLIAAALLPDVAATLRGLYGAPVQGGLTLRPSWVASGLAMALGGTVIASAQALWKLAHLPLLSAPGQQAWARVSGVTRRWQANSGVALAAAGVAVFMLFDGLIAGFALLGGTMLGTALLLPPVLSGVLRVGSRSAKSALMEWVWADTRAQVPALSLALMALLLALATNIGVGTMVSSFRLTFLGWMDQRLSAEIYVTARTDAQGYALHRWFDDQQVIALPIRWSETAVMGELVRIYGVVDDPSYRENWPILTANDAAWDRVMAGNGVLVNEQLARKHGLWPGADLKLGPDWLVPVVGVYSDYGNPNGQVIAALERLLEQSPDLPIRQFGLRLPQSQVAGMIQRIRSEFDLPAGALVDQAQIKSRSLAIFDKTFVVTGALNVLTLGVACFAMLTSLLTVWRQRQPQLAPVWAMGVTRPVLARIEILRSVLLAALTSIIALPLGLVLAWVLLTIINVQAFGWALPMYLFPGDWLRLFGLTILSAILAAAWPALKLLRIAPVDLLKVFANER
ncbi:FtsX-like permease family protein [Rhodobacteraceae bacterium M382]|nr:FtsX-like permease family protein [Rhodobacteraceae bacterium M382]